MKKQLYSKIPVAQSLVFLCHAKGINHIVISPGSRNAPLIIGFTCHPLMHCYSIVDERCAAFFALGLAQQLKKPVALVCTSGSALLNYYPAIAEAFYSDIPLVVVSADRPIERIDIGDGQTIRQKNVFQNHILYSANLYSEIVPQSEILDPKISQKHRESQKHNEREINIALNLAIEQKGPVHINIPFYEPLYDTVADSSVQPVNIPLENSRYSISESVFDEIRKHWNVAKKKLILIGVNSPDALSRQWIDHLAADPSVLVMTETTSNIHHTTHINCIDQLISPLNEEAFMRLQPEILLTFGGLIVSKRIKGFLRRYAPKAHWHVDEKKAFDTYFCLTEHIKTNPNSFFEKLLPTIEVLDSAYKSNWLTIRDYRRLGHTNYLDTVPFCDFIVFREILETVPDYEMIQLSNSSTIRYAQLFSINPTLTVFCNRGTSGIDGSTSTAIGAALASKKPTTLITGDLSFFYDSNALWNNYIPSTFKIILINNSGGGIFRILPGMKDSELFETFFETKHSLTAKNLCKMYDFSYQQASNYDELKEGLRLLYEKNSPALLEIKTPAKINDQVLLEYFNQII